MATMSAASPGVCDLASMRPKCTAVVLICALSVWGSNWGTSALFGQSPPRNPLGLAGGKTSSDTVSLSHAEASAIEVPGLEARLADARANLVTAQALGMG